MNNKYTFIIFYFLGVILLFSGCMASKDYKHREENKKEEEKTEDTRYEDRDLSDGDLIIKTAKQEQENDMYSTAADSTYLYWLNNKVLILKNHSKCNIFAINTLYKAGFKCPKQNARTTDLMNESLFKDILPVIHISSLDEIKKGDLIVWYGHVIIFDSLVTIKNDYYALSIWAGTRQPDNGKSIINNVSYGKYPLKGNFIIRRPIRKS